MSCQPRCCTPDPFSQAADLFEGYLHALPSTTGHHLSYLLSLDCCPPYDAPATHPFICTDYLFEGYLHALASTTGHSLHQQGKPNTISLTGQADKQREQQQQQ
jgi:hypothetical protein